jgi:TonB family protein
MLDQLERQELLEEQQIEQPRLISSRAAFPAENDQRQRRRMVIALILLLVALGLVLVKDRDFWFPSEPETADADVNDDQPATAATEAAAAAPVTQTPAARRVKGHAPAVTSAKQVAAPVEPVPAPARAPLRVEVYAGDSRQPIRAGSPSVRVDMQQAGTLIPSAAASPTESVATGYPVTTAGDRVQMSADARQQLAGRAVRPEYPLLARQMKVQGEVPLMASIATDGHVEKLQVLGGPAILADAAQEAVKQWRFKQQPVATQIPISVVFTISTK